MPTYDWVPNELNLITLCKTEYIDYQTQACQVYPDRDIWVHIVYTGNNDPKQHRREGEHLIVIANAHEATTFELPADYKTLEYVTQEAESLITVLRGETTIKTLDN